VAEHIANPWGGPSVIGQDAAFSGHPPLAARLLASRPARSESFNLRRTCCAILGLNQFVANGVAGVQEQKEQFNSFNRYSAMTAPNSGVPL
jgi:hypothetical protein